MLGLLALGVGIREAPLVDWDEATYAEVAHEAVGSGSYLQFTWNGDPYLKKPPLLFWMVIASFKTFGESAWAARLPSVAAGVGTLVLLYLAAAAVAGRLAGLFAGILPLGFYFFIARGGRECATDGPLVFFSTLAVFALTRARTDRRWLPGVGLACGLAILSKGLAGLIPLAVAALTVLVVPGFGAVGVVGLTLIVGPALAVIAPWLVYEMVRNGGLFWTIFVKQETLSRVATHLELQRQAAASTLPTFIREVRYLWPIALPLVALTVGAVRRGVGRSLRRLPPAVLVWLLWLGLALAAACAVQTKLGWYVLPALLPVALLCGAILGAAFGGRAPTTRGYAPALALLALAILGAEAPGHWRQLDRAFHAERERSRPSYMLGLRAHDIAAARGDVELVFVGVELPTLVYYSGMRSHFVKATTDDLSDLPYHQLVLREPDGALSSVGNFDDEWNVSGPPAERGPAPAGWLSLNGGNSPANDSRWSLLADPAVGAPPDGGAVTAR